MDFGALEKLLEEQSAVGYLAVFRRALARDSEFLSPLSA